MSSDGLDWEYFEKSCLSQSLARFGDNRTKAAQCQKLNYKAFLYRLEKYGLVK
jgi:transcriptional regulator with AAA-type ATPase domain